HDVLGGDICDFHFHDFLDKFLAAGRSCKGQGTGAETCSPQSAQEQYQNIP
ncbi:Hypothetical predicted protein, partial [Marmota monax]